MYCTKDTYVVYVCVRTVSMYMHMAYMYAHTVHMYCTWYIKYYMYILYLVCIYSTWCTYCMYCVRVYCTVLYYSTQYVCMCELSLLLYNGGQCYLCCPVDTLALHIHYRKDLGALEIACKLLLYQLHNYCIVLYYSILTVHKCVYGYCSTARLHLWCGW